jgi:F-type H+-transporting ATPase subunit c
MHHENKIRKKLEKFFIAAFTLSCGHHVYIYIMSGSIIVGLKAVGAGAACSGLIGAGVGIGLVFAALLRAYSINPKLKNQLFAYAILGFALSEAIGLLALVMACIILFT